MVGIVIVSHGPFASSLVETVNFFITDIQQIASVELSIEEDPTKFKVKVKEACAKVDSGEGVVILADLFGGTPSNQASMLINDSTHLISGMNLPMLLDLCIGRMESDPNIDTLIDNSREGIQYMNRYIESMLHEEMFEE